MGMSLRGVAQVGVQRMGARWGRVESREAEERGGRNCEVRGRGEYEELLGGVEWSVVRKLWRQISLSLGPALERQEWPLCSVS